MSSDYAALKDLKKLFQESFSVEVSDTTLWSFVATSDEFAGYVVTLTGTGLGTGGDLPTGGTVTGVLIEGPDGVIADIGSLSISVPDFLDQVGFAVDDEADDDEDEDEDEDEDDDGPEIYGDDDDDIHCDGDDDTVLAGKGDDLVKGRDGHDHLDGQRGNDVLEGGKGKDSLKGGGGRDVLDGGKGSDLLAGGNGRDKLRGGDGDDGLSGGNGKDVLDGGADNDFMSGGKGRDKFVFGEDFGSDVIFKFNAKNETLDFRDTGLAFDDLDIEQTGRQATLTCDEGDIEFIAMKGHLGESDFLF